MTTPLDPETALVARVSLFADLLSRHTRSEMAALCDARAASLALAGQIVAANEAQKCAAAIRAFSELSTECAAVD